MEAAKNGDRTAQEDVVHRFYTSKSATMTKEKVEVEKERKHSKTATMTKEKVEVKKETEKERKQRTLFSLRRKPKDEEEEDDGFEITGPVEVEHQGENERVVFFFSPFFNVLFKGHVSADEAKDNPDIITDAIDSVKNKEKDVDVVSIYAEEIEFAEEYNPNL